MTEQDSLRAALTEDALRYEEDYPHPKRAAIYVGLLILPITWKFARYHVQITDTQIDFGFKTPKTSKVVPLANIIEAEATTIEKVPPKLGGNTIIQKRQGEIRYQVKKGSAVRITVQEEGYQQVYVFNCENPARVCELITAANPQATTQ